MSLLGWLTGADKAAKATNKAYETANQQTQQGYQKATDLLLPGGNYQPAQNKLFDLLGLNGAQGQEAAYGAYRESPGVAFQRQQGEEAGLRAAAAGGGVASGRTMADLSKFNQGVSEQGFGDYYSRLRDMYESTKGTAGQVASGFTSGSNRLADLALGQGQAKAQAATANSPWSIISGLGAIGADVAGAYFGMPPKPKVAPTSASIY